MRGVNEMRNIKVLHISKRGLTKEFYIHFIDTSMVNFKVLSLSDFKSKYTTKPIIRYLLSKIFFNIRVKTREIFKDIKKLFHFRGYKP